MYPEIISVYPHLNTKETKEYFRHAFVNTQAALKASIPELFVNTSSIKMITLASDSQFINFSGQYIGDRIKVAVSSDFLPQDRDVTPFGAVMPQQVYYSLILAHELGHHFFSKLVFGNLPVDWEPWSYAISRNIRDLTEGYAIANAFTLVSRLASDQKLRKLVGGERLDPNNLLLYRQRHAENMLHNNKTHNYVHRNGYLISRAIASGITINGTRLERTKALHWFYNNLDLNKINAQRNTDMAQKVIFGGVGNDIINLLCHVNSVVAADNSIFLDERWIQVLGPKSSPTLV